MSEMTIFGAFEQVGRSLSEPKPLDKPTQSFACFCCDERFRDLFGPVSKRLAWSLRSTVACDLDNQMSKIGYVHLNSTVGISCLRSESSEEHCLAEKS